jgi:preprotein translocase subunit SecD
LPATRVSGVAWTGVVLFGLALASCETPAEPLHLVVASATADTDIRSGTPIVTVGLTADSGRLFTKFTLTNLGRAIDIRVDGKSVSKPVVREPIAGGSFQIAIGEPEEAQRLAARLSNQTATLEVDAASK